MKKAGAWADTDPDETLKLYREIGKTLREHDARTAVMALCMLLTDYYQDDVEGLLKIAKAVHNFSLTLPKVVRET